MMNQVKNSNQEQRKDFDCVEMKRKGAEKIYEEIKDMTRAEELAYWEQKENNSQLKNNSNKLLIGNQG